MTLTSYLMISLFLFIWGMGMAYCYGDFKRVEFGVKVIYTIGVWIASLLWWVIMIWLLVESIGSIKEKQLKQKEKEDDQ